MEKEFFLELDADNNIELFNQASLMNKCLQLSNGAVYYEVGKTDYKTFHDLKLDALEEIIDEAQGSPVLCAYAYESDADRIMQRFKELDPINLTRCKSDRALSATMDKWKSGNCRLMIGHPMSMSHGVDGLQSVGHTLAWFGLTWSLDLYDQFNARIRRQGQGKSVVCHRIISENTLDAVQAKALVDKATTQKDLRQAINDYRKMKYGN
jgi:SNF2 family DNA or RNA helicase